ncbi:MAG: OB-fold domain-containing protein [Pseudomonadota bacterium]|nr:OB-fold domain-containing protein [Pseudomonadota bacterium]
MGALTLLKPDLYGPAAADAGGNPAGPPVLHGGECRCGAVFFPLQPYGCEVCGRHGDDLRPRALAGRGALIAAAVVHIHQNRPGPGAPARQAPFVVGSIALDDGPVVRTLLDAAEAPEPGARMEARLVETGGETPTLDLRFAPVA